MTTVYFVRHAESDISVPEGHNRPLTAKGLADRVIVTEFFKNIKIDTVFSSPMKRAFDTVAPVALERGLPVETLDGFRERGSDSGWDRTANNYEPLRRMWEDFTYTLSDGERLADVQKRNVAALTDVLARYKNKNIVVGTHGTALSTIINHYDNSYVFENFLAMVNIMPWIARLDFDDNDCVGMAFTDPSKPDVEVNYYKRRVDTATLGEYKSYRYVVVFARYRDQWLYCRAKARDGFETAGGHIEPGETPLAAAKRELYEETGAVSFDIEAAFDYGVHVPNAWSYGQVFFARISELGDMPDFEMAEVRLFDAIPDRMRFPFILPVLYENMQYWLNLQSSKDELWDVFDENRNLAGRTHRRGDPMAPGDYHLVVYAWLVNSKGEFLITRRAPNKGFPGVWESTGGSAVSGDDSIKAVVREVKEETGLDVIPERGEVIKSFVDYSAICDVWLFRQDFDIRDVMLQENETIDAKYASEDEIRRMIARGEFFEQNFTEEIFAAAKR